jgi:1,4-alpha-glucan branching enzyme
MIKREAKAGELHLTFVLPQEEPVGRVSVVGDFNSWTPGVHTLARRSNGTRSVKVKVAPGVEYRFRYLGEGGHWFNDPNADAREDDNGVVLT